MTVSNLEKAGMSAIVRATPGPTSFTVLETIAQKNSITLQRLLSYLDLAAGCNIDYDKREVSCPRR